MKCRRHSAGASTRAIWGAVLAHVVYNVTYLVLVVVGTLGAVAPTAPSLG